MPEKLPKNNRGIETLTRVGRDVVFGAVAFDHKACVGCGLCAKACAADAIKLEDQKPMMRPGLDGQCMACGGCVAICPEGAIKMLGCIEFRGFFKYLDRGEPLPPRKF